MQKTWSTVHLLWQYPYWWSPISSFTNGVDYARSILDKMLYMKFTKERFLWNYCSQFCLPFHTQGPRPPVLAKFHTQHYKQLEPSTVSQKPIYWLVQIHQWYLHCLASWQEELQKFQILLNSIHPNIWSWMEIEENSLLGNLMAHWSI
jgi:hypothetical protein